MIGALAYLTYNATLLVYATPFNQLFLAYVALLGFSLWSLVSALLDPQPLLLWDSRLPARGIAAFILVVVALNALAWLSRSTSGSGTRPIPPPMWRPRVASCSSSYSGQRPSSP